MFQMKEKTCYDKAQQQCFVLLLFCLCICLIFRLIVSYKFSKNKTMPFVCKYATSACVIVSSSRPPVECQVVCFTHVLLYKYTRRKSTRDEETQTRLLTLLSHSNS